MSCHKKELANLKIGQFLLYGVRNKGKRIKKIDSLLDLRDTNKPSKIHKIGVPEGEEWENEEEGIFEKIMAKISQVS